MLEKLADGLGLCVVGISSQKKGSSEVHVSVTVKNKNSDTSISDCEKFHRVAMPYLEAEIGRDLLSMEVGTPGIQHVVKDISEFRLFEGYTLRVLPMGSASWIRGKLEYADGDKITVSSYVVEDSSDSGSSVDIKLKDINKAKIL